jgi:hypothetical protein
MGQITNGMAKGERTYSLKTQSGYDGSDREWHGKGRANSLPEGAERVRQESDLSITIRFERTYQLSTESGTVVLSFRCNSLWCSDIPTGNE